jgi:hypothetical protein
VERVHAVRRTELVEAVDRRLAGCRTSPETWYRMPQIEKFGHSSATSGWMSAVGCWFRLTAGF